MLKIVKQRKGLNLYKAAVYCVAVSIGSLAMVQPAEAQLKTVLKTEKYRIIALTDIGGDLDDMQSFTRFLLYADQYDIKGLLATSIRIFPHSTIRPPDGEPQPHYLVEWVKAYGQVRDNLLKNSKEDAKRFVAKLRIYAWGHQNADRTGCRSLKRCRIWSIPNEKVIINPIERNSGCMI